MNDSSPEQTFIKTDIPDLYILEQIEDPRVYQELGLKYHGYQNTSDGGVWPNHQHKTQSEYFIVYRNVILGCIQPWKNINTTSGEAIVSSEFRISVVYSRSLTDSNLMGTTCGALYPSHPVCKTMQEAAETLFWMCL